MSAKKYLLYDERAHYDLDRAHVLCVANSLAEAQSDKEKMFPDAVIYEYDVRDNELINEREVRS